MYCIVGTVELTTEALSSVYTASGYVPLLLSLLVLDSGITMCEMEERWPICSALLRTCSGFSSICLFFPHSVLLSLSSCLSFCIFYLPCCLLLVFLPLLTLASLFGFRSLPSLVASPLRRPSLPIFCGRTPFSALLPQYSPLVLLVLHLHLHSLLT